MTVTCIITRYKETIDWIEYIAPSIDIFYIYNKGPDDIFFRKDLPDEIRAKIKIRNLPNVGRIDHTIAYHILEHWDHLDETLVFLPASILMCKLKGSYLSGINKRISVLKERYSGYFSPRFHHVSPKFNYSIDNYVAEGVCNKNDNPFIKSEYPDFQAWKKALVDDRPMRYVGMRGMFAVSKENVLHIDKKIYQNILNSLIVGDNVENGHFAERIWAHLFRQYSFDSKVPGTGKEDFEII